MKRLLLIGGGLLAAAILAIVLVINLTPDPASPSDPSFSYTQAHAAKQPDATSAIVIAQNKVKAHLKAADDVDFDLLSGKAIDKGNGLFVVRDHLKVTNAAGVKKTVNYLVELQYEGGEAMDANNWMLKNVVVQ